MKETESTRLCLYYFSIPKPQPAHRKREMDLVILLQTSLAMQDSQHAE